MRRTAGLSKRHLDRLSGLFSIKWKNGKLVVATLFKHVEIYELGLSMFWHNLIIIS